MSFKVEKQFKDKSVVFVSWFITDILFWLYTLVDILIFQSLCQKITTHYTEYTQFTKLKNVLYNFNI